MQFKNLPIIPPIMKAVEKAGYTTATEIQSKTIPHTLKGGDIIGCAQTGTEKRLLLPFLYFNFCMTKK